MDQQNASTTPIPYPPEALGLGIQCFPINRELLQDDSVVDRERLAKIKMKIEKAADAAEKASEDFGKLYSSLVDLSTSANETEATWDEAVQRYISEEGANIRVTTTVTSNNNGNSVANELADDDSSQTDQLIEELPVRKRARKKRTKKFKDPNRPKKPPNAFMMFLVEQCDEMKAKDGAGGAVSLHAPHVGKIVGEKWKELPQEQKKVYEERYDESKKKYEQDLKIYYSTRTENDPEAGKQSNVPPQNNNKPRFPNTSHKPTSHRGPGRPPKQPAYSLHVEPSRQESSTTPTEAPRVKRKYAKRTPKPKDANRPKKPANPYAMYLADQCGKMRINSEPGALNAPHIGKVVSEQWRVISAEDRQKYQDRYNIAKSKYDEEMKIYNANLLNKTASKKPVPVGGVVIANGATYHDFGTPLPNGDNDDLDTEYKKVSPAKNANPAKIETVDSEVTSESDAMEDVVYTESSDDRATKGSTATQTSTAAEPPRKRKSREDEEDNTTSDSQEDDARNGEISPSKWSFKGLFSSLKRSKFF